VKKIKEPATRSAPGIPLDDLKDRGAPEIPERFEPSWLQQALALQKPPPPPPPNPKTPRKFLEFRNHETRVIRR
jgi:hypothetical protein